MISIQNISLTDDAVTIQYVEDTALDRDSGIIEAIAVSIPHDVLPTALLTDLVEAVEAIVDEARVIRRRPVESFKAPR